MEEEQKQINNEEEYKEIEIRKLTPKEKSHLKRFLSVMLACAIIVLIIWSLNIANNYNDLVLKFNGLARDCWCVK